MSQTPYINQSRHSKLTTRSLLAFSSVAVIPLLLVLGGFHLRSVSGPYWLSDNLDPTYPYLLNSLNLSNFHRPYHTDHPGTPIQILGGSALRFWVNGDEANRANEVIGHSEAYITSLNKLLIVLYGLCLFAAGVVSYFATRDFVLCWITQLVPFLSLHTLEGMLGFRPEPLILAIAILVAAVVQLKLKFEGEEYEGRFALTFGLLIGLGIACKINFIPVFFVPLLLLRTLRARVLLAGCTALTFMVGIVPILAPAQLINMFAFLRGISTHTGRYGLGAPGFINMTEYVKSLFDLISGDKLFFLVIGISFLVIFSRHRTSNGRSPALRALIAVTVAEILQLLMVAKHPHSRYLLPSLGLISLNVVLIIYELRRGNPFSRVIQSKLVRVLPLVFLLFLAGKHFSESVHAMTSQAEQRLALARRVKTDYPDVSPVYYYNASSLPYSLKFGLIYSGNIYASTAQRLFPNEFFYNPWQGNFSDFVDTVDVKTVSHGRGWFLLQGGPIYDADFKKYLPEKYLPENIQINPIYPVEPDIPGSFSGEVVSRAEINSGAK